MFLLPDLHSFFQLHLALDDQHVYDANVLHMTMLLELLTQLLPALFL